MERKKIDTRTKLNLTQVEMAMLLKITRSQWSLFELGLRSIPTAAMVKHTELILFLETPINKTAKPLPQQEEQLLKKNKMHEEALAEALYKQEEVALKIAKMEKKYAAAVEVLQLLSEDSDASKSLEALDSSTLHLLKYKATKTLDKNGQHHLAKLQLDQQFFIQQVVLLKALLKKE